MAGETGATGARGPRGTTGATGATGPIGPRGFAGEDARGVTVVPFDHDGGNVTIRVWSELVVTDVYVRVTEAFDENATFSVGNATVRDGYILTRLNATIGPIGLDAADTGAFLRGPAGDRDLLLVARDSIVVTVMPGTSKMGEATAYVVYTKLA